MGRISQAFARIPVKCIHTVYVHTAICTLNYSKKTWQICISRICLYYIALLCRPAMSSTQDVFSVVHKNSCETVFFAPILESPNFFPSKCLEDLMQITSNDLLWTQTPRSFCVFSWPFSPKAHKAPQLKSRLSHLGAVAHGWYTGLKSWGMCEGFLVVPCPSRKGQVAGCVDTGGLFSKDACCKRI